MRGSCRSQKFGTFAVEQPVPRSTFSVSAASLRLYFKMNDKVRPLSQEAAPLPLKLPPKHLFTCTVGRNRSQAR